MESFWIARDVPCTSEVARCDECGYPLFVITETSEHPVSAIGAGFAPTCDSCYHAWAARTGREPY